MPNRVWPWNGPMSSHEGKVLEATDKVYKYSGKCLSCKDLVTITTIYPKMTVCCECSHNLPRFNKRKKQ